MNTSIRVRSAACLLCAALALPLPATAARSAEEPLPNPILAPGAPWAFDGFVVNAPLGDDWASFTKTQRSAELGRKFEDGRTAAIVISTSRHSASMDSERDLLALVERMEATPVEPKHMRLIEFSRQPYSPKGALCAKSRARFDDARRQYAAPGLLVVHALTCARPDRQDIVVNIRFAERMEAAQPAALDANAEEFLAGLRFVVPAGPIITRAREAVASKHASDAAAMLASAAAEGDGEAALMLGNLYLYATGVDEDLEAARKYLEIAAGDGRRDALYNLGAIYDKGIGVARNPLEAIRWFTRAADQRDAQAQMNLALFYLRGDGVAPDRTLAEAWLRRAAGNGSKRAAGILESGRFGKQ